MPVSSFLCELSFFKTSALHFLSDFGVIIVRLSWFGFFNANNCINRSKTSRFLSLVFHLCVLAPADVKCVISRSSHQINTLAWDCQYNHITLLCLNLSQDLGAKNNLDTVHQDDRPHVLLVGNLNGDSPVGQEMLVRLARHLITGYFYGYFCFTS